MKLVMACAAAAIVFAASQAAAQTAPAGAAADVSASYGRIVVFGDSLSDNGNLYRATGGAQPAAPYFQGRYSNGPVWVERLGFANLQNFGAVTGNVDNAFGGARTDLQTSPPSLRVQLQGYQAAGGRFGAGDLAVVWGGANNLFQGFAPAGASGNPTAAISATATSAAADIGAVAQAVAAGGAGTVLVGNLPDLGVTPQFAGGPAAQLASYATVTFNAALNAQLAAVSGANPNANLILMDVNRSFAAIQADPAAYGLSNVTASCFGAAGVCTNPDSYLFWDGVHPTAAGHRLVAALAADYTTYGDRGASTATQGEAGLFSRRRSADAALGRLHLADAPERVVTFLIDGEDGTADVRGVVGESDYREVSGRIVAEQALGDWRVGGLISYGDGRTKAGLLSYDATAISLDLYAGRRWTSGLYVGATVGGGRNDFGDIRRVTGVGSAVHTAQTHGKTFGGEIEAGWAVPAGAFILTPRLGLSAARADVDGYAEEGPAARHRVADRKIDAVAYEAALRIDTPIFNGFSGFVEGGWRDYLSYDADAVRIGLVDNTARVLSRKVDEADGQAALLNVGLSGRWGAARVDLGYRGRFGDYESHGGALAVSWGF